ncbi:MAG: hypothetical protein ACQ5SW_08305 [Sphaerochaetaceae bacterium]
MQKQYLIKYQLLGRVKFKTSYDFKTFIQQYKMAMKADKYVEILKAPWWARVAMKIVVFDGR